MVSEGPADQPHDVHFVDDAGADGADEELPVARRAGWRPRAEAFARGRYGLPLAVVAAVLILLVGRALLHEKPAGAPPATPSGSVTLDAGTGRVATPLPRRSGDDPTLCPGLQCYTAASVPDAVRAAVHAVFPQARVTAVETVRLVDPAAGNPLWYRELVARQGALTLTVQVQAHADGDVPDGGAKDDGHLTTTYVDAALQQWFVRARTTDRSGSADVFERLSALVDDARLVIR